MATDQTVAQAFALLSANWPDRTIAPETVSLFAEMFRDIPDRTLMMATVQWIATQKWWPRVADLRQTAKRIELEQLGLPSPREAWVLAQALAQAPRGTVRSRLKKAPAPVREALRKIGGTEALRVLRIADVPRWRETFEGYYVDATEKIGDIRLESPKLLTDGET